MKSTIHANYQSICDQIEEACALAGRDPGSITMVAVTKYARWEWVRALSEIHTTFGESRPQQLAERQPLLPSASWHLIGPLQRNKVKLALRHSDVVHSVDSVKLLNRLAAVAQETRPPRSTLRLLLQVNVSGEASKSGFPLQHLKQVWPELSATPRNNIDICGLMTMAPHAHHAETSRGIFRSLVELRDELNDIVNGAAPEEWSGEPAENLPGGRSELRSEPLESQCSPPMLHELSMGMSSDFAVAVEEGATLIRIGKALFEGLS